MRVTKNKYNPNDSILPEYDNDEIAYIDKRQKEFDSLPSNIKVELYMWLSRIARTYWLDYTSLLAMTRYEVWLLILKIENDRHSKV